MTVQLPASPLSSWAALLTALLNQPCAACYPIVAYEFLYVRQDMTSTRESGSLVLALAKFMLSDEGQAALPGFSLAPIPPVIAARVQTYFNQLYFANGITQWAFEPLPTPQLGTGAGARVYSAFRGSYTDYASQLADIQSSALYGMLQAGITALIAQAGSSSSSA